MSSTIWDLTDATSAVGTQRIPVATAAAAGSNAFITPAYLRAYVAANMTPITLTGGTVTSSTPVLDATQTWNSGGVTFTGWKLNVTDTASAAASLLVDLQVGGSSRLNVGKTGAFVVNTPTGFTGNFVDFQINGSSWLSATSSGGTTWVRPGAGGGNSIGIGNYAGFSAAPFLLLAASGQVTATVNSNGFRIDGGPLQFSGDTYLYRDAANTLALRNSTSAQTFNWYFSYTDGSNYARGALKTASSYVEMAAETAGTGADNINVKLTPAGTGTVQFGTHSAIAAETVTGYITITDAGGTTRKLAVVS